MSDKHYAFVDRKCPACYGHGDVGDGDYIDICPECHGTGIIGSYEKVPDIQFNGDKEFGDLLRRTRSWRLIYIRELAEFLGLKASHISEIELGIVMPTDKEREKLEKWINGKELLA